MNGISVIICCYNSAPRLPATLRHLAAQRVGPADWEVIVVDNNSADDTAAVAGQQWAALGQPAPLLVVAEPRPGLSHARQAGLAAARHPAILFCDDDNWLAPDYLREALALLAADPRLGIVGGLNTGVSDGPLPAWFAEVAYAYACGPQAAQDGEVSPQRLYVAGAGMVARRAIFRELDATGFESQLLDRTGEELSSGGDTELCFLTALLGYKIGYSARLRLQHYMPANRLQWSYLLKLMHGHAQSAYRLEFYKQAYRREAIESRWGGRLRRLLVRYASRDGLFELYHYLRLRLGHQDVYGLHGRFQLEVINAHLRSFNQYESIVKRVEELRKRVVSAVPASVTASS